MSLTKASYSMITGAPVNVLDRGADPTGVADSTSAIQSAINTGRPVYFPSGTYKVTSTISYTGTVNISGDNATIQSSALTFKFTDASNSRVKGLNFLPATVPYTIRRNTNTWVNTSADVVQSYEGYMPTTPADNDIWSGLSPAIQAQTTTNTFTWPAIWFFSSSATENTNVEVSEVTGFTLTIAFDGYVNSTVRDCNFGAGASIGGVIFNNNVAQNYQYGGLAYTLAQGVNNSAINNIVRYATYSNIWFSGNICFTINGNQTSWSGETGIKLNQTDGSATNPAAVVNTFGVIDGNLTFNNANDGIDAAATFGLAASFKYTVNTVVSNNQCLNNKYSGIVSPGVKYLSVTGNSLSFNGQFGLTLNGSDCTVTGNTFNQNSYHPELFVGVTINDCLLTGDNICSTSNYIYNPVAPSTFNYVHQGVIGGADPTVGSEGLDSGNVCSGGITRFFLSPNIPSNQTDIVAGTGKFTANTSVTLSALNTWVTVVSSETGMILLRDDTSGGTALFLFDPLSGVVSVSNTITGLATQISSGNFQIQVTSGTVPRTISWAAFLTS
jgi:parallel beta-helix repeat protein